jgi:hypothetical protein
MLRVRTVLAGSLVKQISKLAGALASRITPVARALIARQMQIAQRLTFALVVTGSKHAGRHVSQQTLVVVPLIVRLLRHRVVLALRLCEPIRAAVVVRTAPADTLKRILRA